ncbi:hypothetical protein [Sporomusa aerivorans]|uniref:hypothetical protein n=1 Tax=Sporomusa aerivorans TaxID=204936 RepID=UPI003529EC68
MMNISLGSFVRQTAFPIAPRSVILLVSLLSNRIAVLPVPMSADPFMADASQLSIYQP